MLKELCLLNGTSGDECAVKDYIVSKIKEDDSGINVNIR